MVFLWDTITICNKHTICTDKYLFQNIIVVIRTTWCQSFDVLWQSLVRWIEKRAFCLVLLVYPRCSNAHNCLKLMLGERWYSFRIRFTLPYCMMYMAQLYLAPWSSEVCRWPRLHTFHTKQVIFCDTTAGVVRHTHRGANGHTYIHRSCSSHLDVISLIKVKHWYRNITMDVSLLYF